MKTCGGIYWNTGFFGEASWDLTRKKLVSVKPPQVLIGKHPFFFRQFHVKLDETGWFGFSWKPHFFFFCGQFQVKLVKNVWFFSAFWLKNETGCGFMYETDIKLWNRPELSQEKKWNWRHAASPRPSVSFFFPDRIWTVS